MYYVESPIYYIENLKYYAEKTESDKLRCRIPMQNVKKPKEINNKPRRRT